MQTVSGLPLSDELLVEAGDFQEPPAVAAAEHVDVLSRTV